MLRPEIFDWLLGAPLKIGRADDKFILRRYVNAESRAVTDHVENILVNYRGLADHANAGGPGSQNKAVHFMVLRVSAGMRGARREFHGHASVQRLDRLRLAIVGIEQLLFRRGLQRRRRLGRLDDGLVADGAAEGKREHHCHGSDPDNASNSDISNYIRPAYKHKVCNLTAAQMGVNETGMCLEMIRRAPACSGVVVRAGEGPRC